MHRQEWARNSLLLWTEAPSFDWDGILPLPVILWSRPIWSWCCYTLQREWLIFAMVSFPGP